MKVRIAGDTLVDGESLTINPEDIAGQFDLRPIDGTQPIDRFAQAQFWQQAMATALQLPGVGEQYRMPDLFEYVAKLGGLKAIGQFRLQRLTDGDYLALVREANQQGGQNGGQASAAGQTVRSDSAPAGPVANTDPTAGVDSALATLI